MQNVEKRELFQPQTIPLLSALTNNGELYPACIDIPGAVFYADYGGVSYFSEWASICPLARKNCKVTILS